MARPDGHEDDVEQTDTATTMAGRGPGHPARRARRLRQHRPAARPGKRGRDLREPELRHPGRSVAPAAPLPSPAGRHPHTWSRRRADRWHVARPTDPRARPSRRPPPRHDLRRGGVRRPTGLRHRAVSDHRGHDHPARQGVARDGRHPDPPGRHVRLGRQRAEPESVPQRVRRPDPGWRRGDLAVASLANQGPARRERRRNRPS